MIRRGRWSRRLVCVAPEDVHAGSRDALTATRVGPRVARTGDEGHRPPGSPRRRRVRAAPPHEESACLCPAINAFGRPWRLALMRADDEAEDWSGRSRRAGPRRHTSGQTVCRPHGAAHCCSARVARRPCCASTVSHQHAGISLRKNEEPRASQTNVVNNS
jgi:hypothetical protein